MLASLAIRNLALIEDLTVELDGGLNIVTGETGAGKSIVIGAIGLILGQRADKSLLRSGAETCEITAVVELQAAPALLTEVNARLEAGGVPPCEEGQLILRRVFGEKTARHYVNAAAVPLRVLAELGELLVDVHGPYDHQSLLHPRKQLLVLDAFGGLDADRAKCQELHRQLTARRADLARQEQERPSPDQLELLRFQLAELRQAEPQPGEDEELSRRHALAAHGQQLLELLADCRRRLEDEEGSILDATRGLMRQLLEVEKIDAAAGRGFVDGLEAAIASLQALIEDLARYGDKVEIDPEEFARMEERLGVLQRLKRKYGGSLERVLAYRAQIEDKLARLDDFDGYLAKLRAQEAEAAEALRQQALALSRERRRHARRLAPRIAAKLKLLGFPQAEFEIRLEDAEPGPGGMDSVEFHFAPNPGEGIRPLRDIASSGEISRVMLALKTVLAAADQVPILIFDEVDANIGGEVAHAVARELRRLGQERQVLCITHLPQVAAAANRHFSVRKETKGKRTQALMQALDAEAQVRELARMLGGERSSSVVREHAAQLLANARAE